MWKPDKSKHNELYIKIFIEKCYKEKVKNDKFRSTGIDIRRMEDGIEISIEDYAESLELIEIRDDKSDENLTKDELKVWRKYIGKLN